MSPSIIAGSPIFINEATRSAEDAKLTQFVKPQNQEVKQNAYQWKIVWRNVFAFIYLHYAVLHGLYFVFTRNVLLTLGWNLFLAFLVSQGITAGAHRLWAHKAYKANLPLRILLAFCFTIAFQDDIHQWARDHRTHHKFCDTDADPYNAKRGFFFSHMGWLITRKHPEVKAKAKSVDMSDILADPVVRFQRKYYLILMPICCFVMPTLVPYYFWNESFVVAWNLSLMRYAVTLHATWLVNSAAHIYGDKPFDKNITPRENRFVSIITCGEGWHNYHHVFPWDYKASELGFQKLNVTAGIIEFFARIGWAFELKTVSEDMVRRRAKRTGDGSHEGEYWGWGDKDMSKCEQNEIVTFNNLKKF
nr:acyl-CoA Delta(11) desaturase-like [Onthophagus taurus]